MVSQKNVLTVKDVSEQIKKYPIIGVIDMFKLPASQLHQIRGMLRDKATIRMVKKRLIKLAFKESGLKGVDALGDRLRGEPALIMTDMNPFKLATLISDSKSEAPAKEGDASPRDITVPAGPTSLPPGPVIGELQKAKIPASIEGDKIHVREDTVVAKEGDTIDGLLAGVLSKLGIMPMEIGLDLIAVWDNGTIYEKDILFIPPETYVNDLVAAHQRAFNLAFNTGYPTRDTVPLLLSRAHQEAYSLALSADILTAETVKPLLAKAHSQAEALKSKAGVTDAPPAEPPSEDAGTPGDEQEGEPQPGPDNPSEPQDNPPNGDKPEDGPSDPGDTPEGTSKLPEEAETKPPTGDNNANTEV